MTSYLSTIRFGLPLCLCLSATAVCRSQELAHGTGAANTTPAASGESVGTQVQHANLWIDVSDQLLSNYVGQPFHERSPVNEVILGTHYSGSSVTDGQLAVHLVPSESSIAMSFSWNGSVASSTCGTNGRATVQSRSTTNISASKLVLQDNRGWHVQPAAAQVNTCSRIADVSTGRLLGRRVAIRRADEQRPAVEHEVTRRAAARARRDLDHNLGEALTTMQNDFDRRIRDPLAERELLPTVVHRRTDGNAIQFALLQANRSQLGASTPPPPRHDQNRLADLSVRVHASAINNVATSMLGGETFDARELAEQMAGFFGPRASEADRGDEEEPLTIRFRDQDPFHAEFNDGRISLTLNADGFTIGAKSVPRAKIAVTYKLGVSGSMVTGVREGKIQTDLFVHEDKTSPRVGVRHQVLRSMLRKRFEPVFPEEFKWQPVSRPVDGSLASGIPSHVRLDVENCRLADGWLSIWLRSTPVQAPRVAHQDFLP